MFTSTIEFRIAAFAMVIFFLSLCSCEQQPCDVYEPELEIIFFDSLDQEVFKIFDRVYGIHGSGDLMTEEGRYHLPIDLTRDSVFYLFEQEDQIDTLAIYYSRNLTYSGKEDSYCISLGYPLALYPTTFEVDCIDFDHYANSQSAIFPQSYTFCSEIPFQAHIALEQ